MAHGCVFLANDLDRPDGPACCKKDGLTVRNIFTCKLYGPSAFVVLMQNRTVWCDNYLQMIWIIQLGRSVAKRMVGNDIPPEYDQPGLTSHCVQA